MESYATINEEAEQGEARAGARCLEVRVPASTSNLGAGFDCFGLALQLYLTVRATTLPAAAETCRLRTIGEGSAALAGPPEKNLIYRTMRFVAARRGFSLPPLRLAVRNEIPLGGGLGSSAAAIVAGLTLCGELGEAGGLTNDELLGVATELEGHADNVAASLYGGWVTACVKGNRVLAVKRAWPREIRVIVVSPDAHLDTGAARAALPAFVPRDDAVYNLQRAALLGAALETGADELLWEATQDRLHQAHRQHLVPGLAEALALPRLPGLLGLALSGAGPGVIALARDHFTPIGETIADCFRRRGIGATVRLLEVDERGRTIQRWK